MIKLKFRKLVHWHHSFQTHPHTLGFSMSPISISMHPMQQNATNVSCGTQQKHRRILRVKHWKHTFLYIYIIIYIVFLCARLNAYSSWLSNVSMPRLVIYPATKVFFPLGLPTGMQVVRCQPTCLGQTGVSGHDSSLSSLKSIHTILPVPFVSSNCFWTNFSVNFFCWISRNSCAAVAKAVQTTSNNTPAALQFNWKGNLLVSHKFILMEPRQKRGCRQGDKRRKSDDNIIYNDIDVGWHHWTTHKCSFQNHVSNGTKVFGDLVTCAWLDLTTLQHDMNQQIKTNTDQNQTRISEIWFMGFTCGDIYGTLAEQNNPLLRCYLTHLTPTTVHIWYWLHWEYTEYLNAWKSMKPTQRSNCLVPIPRLMVSCCLNPYLDFPLLEQLTQFCCHTWCRQGSKYTGLLRFTQSSRQATGLYVKSQPKGLNGR